MTLEHSKPSKIALCPFHAEKEIYGRNTVLVDLLSSNVMHYSSLVLFFTLAICYCMVPTLVQNF